MKKIKEVLIMKYGYSEYSASMTEQDLFMIQDHDLRDALDQWLYNDECPLVTSDKFDSKTLVEKFHMTYPAALIFISWHRQDPAVAEQSMIRL